MTQTGRRTRRLTIAVALAAATLLALAVATESSQATFRGENGLILFDTNSLGEPCSGGGLYVDSPGGGHRRLLAEGHGGRFSRDSTRILFDSCDGVTTDIEIVSLDGGHRGAIVDLDVSVDSPAWGPRGRIVFVRDRHPTGQGHSDLWTVMLDGTRMQRLTGDRSEENDPEWAPNGRFIAFSEGGRIKTIRPDGSRERTHGRGVEPSISPNSRMIAFERFGDIWISRADGSHARRLVKARGGTGGAFGPGLGQPVFAPEGNWVLYTRVSYASYGPGTVSWAELCRVRINGRGNERLRRTPRPIDEFNADWQVAF